MRAILCKELGPANTLVIDDIPSPEPGKGQVKVRVKAAGLNFPDTLIIEGKYQIKPALPFTPGSVARDVRVPDFPDHMAALTRLRVCGHCD